MITGIQQIHIPVQDINRAIDFYENTLGLKQVMAFPEQHMAFFDCNGVRIYLGKNPEYESKPFIYYASNDIQSDYQALVSNKVEIIKEPIMIHKTEKTESWLCAFKDSEGNILHFMQER